MFLLPITYLTYCSEIKQSQQTLPCLLNMSTYLKTVGNNLFLVKTEGSPINIFHF